MLLISQYASRKYQDTHIFKFQYQEPKKGVFNFTGGDNFLALAEKSGAKVRCHNLIWSSQQAPFLYQQKWTKASLTAVMENHIKSVIAHYGKRCYSWDVINEALLGNGSFSSSVWYDNIGPDYFHLAFQFAQEAVKAAGGGIKLYYNDYGIESPGDKVNSLRKLVQDLQTRKIQIDGIGLESHFISGSTPSTANQLAVMKTFTALGLEVAQTELDVRIPKPPFYTKAVQAQQAKDYYTSVTACMQAGAKCIGTTVWDFADKYSWVPSVFAPAGAADIFNNTWSAKPAYFAIAEALQKKPCTVC